MPPFDAAVFDLDGTLLDSRKRITERTRAALDAARRSGMHLVFATARPPRAIRHLGLEELGSMAYLNGAMVRCGISGAEWSHALDREIADRVLECLAEALDAGSISVESGDRWLTRGTGDFSARFRVADAPVLVEMEEWARAECHKILVLDHPDYEFLRTAFGEHCTLVRTDGGELVQITAQAATKENAVASLCLRHGWRLERILCFGDDFNDLGLFRACGYPVAMGNAIAGLKALARETAPGHDEDGVARVLERLLVPAGG